MSRPQNPLPYSRQLFAVLPSTLCRTFPNSLPYSHPLTAKGLSVHGKEPCARRQRIAWPRPKKRLDLAKAPHNPAQSSSQTAAKFPPAALQKPVVSSLKPYGPLIPSRQAIEAEPSGFWRQAVGLSRQTSRAFKVKPSGDRPQKVATPIDRNRQADRTIRHLSIDRPPLTRYNDSAPSDVTTRPKR